MPKQQDSTAPTSARHGSALLLERLQKAAQGKSINEIDSMLMALRLSQAQRAFLIARRRQLTRVATEEFILETMQKSNLSRATICRDLQRARILGLDGLRKLINTKLDSDKQLAALIKLPEDERERRMNGARR